MTILQDDPIACLDTLLNHLLSFWTLSLPKRDFEALLLFGFSILFQGIKRICSWRKYEYQWCTGSRILKYESQIKWWRCDEVVTNFVNYEVGNCRYDQIWSNASLETHKLEFIKILPFAGKFKVLWSARSVHLLIDFVVFHKVIQEAFESRQFVQSIELAPQLF